MDSRRRRWEVVWYPYPLWHFHIRKPFGKTRYGGVFMVETWIGPLCLKVWKNPLSASLTPFRRARID